jgi:hypothetical protein
MGWNIDRRSIEVEWEGALLQIPDEILREEIAFGRGRTRRRPAIDRKLR